MKKTRGVVVVVSCGDVRCGLKELSQLAKAGTRVVWLRTFGGEPIGQLVRKIEQRYVATLAGFYVLTHRDCGEVRTQIGLPFTGEITRLDAERLEAATHTRRARWMRQLRRRPMIAAALRRRQFRLRSGHDPLGRRKLVWD